MLRSLKKMNGDSRVRIRVVAHVQPPYKVLRISHLCYVFLVLVHTFLCLGRCLNPYLARVDSSGDPFREPLVDRLALCRLSGWRCCSAKRHMSLYP
jgi:hypothetical protein